MKSRRNLTRFTYETTAFRGWRLCLSRAGTTFTRYFSDKKYGGPQKSLATAEKALNDLKQLVENSRRVNGKLSQATIREAEKLLDNALWVIREYGGGRDASCDRRAAVKHTRAKLAGGVGTSDMIICR